MSAPWSVLLAEWVRPQLAGERTDAEMWAEGNSLLLEALYAHGNAHAAMLKFTTGVE